jgi:two-component system, OmpR family, sensor kinase
VKPRFVSRFDMLPIRWRLAVTSAILTFVILLTFGLVIAFFTERQMENDFNDEVRDNATRIQQRLQEQVETTVDGGYRIDARDELLEFASADDVVIRVLDTNGDVGVETADAPELGSPRPGLQDVGNYRVSSR